MDLELIKKCIAVIVEAIYVHLLILFTIPKSLFLFLIPLSWQEKDVNEEIVLITGAGSGMGRILALKFARKGSTVVLWDINEKGNCETLEQIIKQGGRGRAYTVNLCNKEEIYKTADQVMEEVGSVTMLINNAGMVTGKKLLESPDHMIEATMQVNIMSHFWATKAFLPQMIAQNHGHIVTLASSAGLLGVSGLVDYSTSKFAAVGFIETLRYELEAAGKNIQCTCICPAFVNTGMFDGVQSKFSGILPIMDVEDATDRMMSAILTNTPTFCIPKSIYIFAMLKQLLPVEAHLLIAEYYGANQMMDRFKGRQNCMT